MPPEIMKGLKDVYFDTTESSFIDGIEGKLLYRGYNIHDLAEKSTFEEVVYLPSGYAEGSTEAVSARTIAGFSGEKMTENEVRDDIKFCPQMRSHPRCGRRFRSLRKPSDY